MIYTNLRGEEGSCVVVSQGPLHGTVWAYDGDRPIVVRAKDAVEVEHIPVVWFPRPSPEAVEMAREIQHREWRCAVREDPYLSSVQGKPSDAEIVRPTPAQTAAAAEVLELLGLHGRAVRAYRQAHQARGSIAEARLVELMRTSCVSETISSAENPQKNND